MIAIGDGMVESRSAGGVLPRYCVESPTVSEIRPSTLSPAATVCKDDDVMSGKRAPEFKLSQCFGDCSPAEEATQGERPDFGRVIHTHPFMARIVYGGHKYRRRVGICIAATFFTNSGTLVIIQQCGEEYET